MSSTSASGVGGLILAAGESTRMGRDKALLPWPPGTKQTLLSTAIASYSDFCELVSVVAGNNEPELRRVVYGAGAYLVRNPDPERGQFSSLQTGLQEVLNHGRDSALVTLVDRPPASRETLCHLLAAFATRNRGTWAIVPEFQAKHGHPILIGRDMIEAFLKAPVSSNAREIEHAHQDRIHYLAVDDPNVTLNLNTPEDYSTLEPLPNPR